MILGQLWKSEVITRDQRAEQSEKGIMKMQRGSERSRVSHCRLETDVVASCIRQVEKPWRQTGASLERNADLLTPWRQLSKRELPTDNNDVACC